MKDTSGVSADQSAVRDECLALWGLPESVAHGYEYATAEEFFSYEIEKGDQLYPRQAIAHPLVSADSRFVREVRVVP